MNDGNRDCDGWDDEDVDGFACRPDEFSCVDGRRCVPRSWVNNNAADCADGSDERVKRFRCLAGEFACSDGRRCLGVEMACDGVQNCADGSDETVGCGSAPMMMARCRAGDDSQLFPWSSMFTDDNIDVGLFCVGMPDFRNRSDLLTGFKCFVRDFGALSRGTVATARKRLVPAAYLAAGFPVCHNGDDVCRDASGAFNCSRCLDGAVISPAQLCDGVIDCADLSDECTCQHSPARPLCKAVYGAGGSFALGAICDGRSEIGWDEAFCDDQVLRFGDDGATERASEVRCVSEDGRAVGTRELCDGRIDCVGKTDECASECFRRRLADSDIYLGRVEPLRAYLRECFGFGEFVDNMLLFNATVSEEGVFRVIKDNVTDQEPCELAVSFFPRMDVPDHITTTLHTSPCQPGALPRDHPDLEFLCELDGVECPWLHVCASDTAQRIGHASVCDHTDDCADGSDELGCPPATQFYCAAGAPRHIEAWRRGDGKSDCADRSDECAETEFSSATQMIKSAPLRNYVWISALAILLCNGAVLRKHVKRLRGVKSKQSAAFCNTFALINLALSDVIFGVTLLSIGLRSVQYSGAYCELDLAWRSGLHCELIGVLTVVSSQTSMNLLVLMTLLRLYVTYKPFMTNRLSWKLVYLLTALSWAVGLVVGLAPLLRSSLFVHSLYVEPNPFIKDHLLPISELRQYISSCEKIFARSNHRHHHHRSESEDASGALDEWYFGTATGRARFPRRHVTVRGTLGYYSSSSVCFPDFYSHGDGAASHYSLAIILYNAACLLVITAGYALIFAAAERSDGHNRRSTSVSSVRIVGVPPL
ncbi:MAG: hypothetical protein AAFP26_07560 [Planctomycetota bacterium]